MAIQGYTGAVTTVSPAEAMPPRAPSHGTLTMGLHTAMFNGKKFV